MDAVTAEREAGQSQEGYEEKQANDASSNASAHNSRFVFSKGDPPREEAWRDRAEQDRHVLSVDLIGPPLLFQGLASLVFSFDEVNRVRLLADRQSGWPTVARPPRHQVALHDSPNPPCSLVRVFWHECLAPLPLPPAGHSAALYGNAGDAGMPEARAVSVAFSIYDTPDTLRAGLLAAASGNTFRSPRLPDAPAELSRPASLLSTREYQVTALAAQGWTNPAIAEHLYLSSATVKTHLQRAFAKLGIQRRTQLYARLESCGIFPPGPPCTQSIPGTTPRSVFSGAEYDEIWCETKEGSAYTVLLDGVSDV